MSENRYQGLWHTTTIDDEHTHVFHPTNGKPNCKLQNTTVVINQSPVSIPLTNVLIGVGGRVIKTAQQIKTPFEIENASPYALTAHQDNTVPIYYIKRMSVDTFQTIPEWIGKAEEWLDQFTKVFKTTRQNH